jgi:hypothetical protein
MLRPDGQVEPVKCSEPEGQQVLAYVDKCMTTQGLNGAIDPTYINVRGHEAARIIPLR